MAGVDADPRGETDAALGTAGRGDAEAVAFVEPEIIDAPGRADDRAAVRGVADGAVIDLLDADLAERRHAGDGSLDMGLEPIDVGSVKDARWVEGMLMLWINNRYGSTRNSFDYYLRRN